ncbi:MAG: amidohydrolase family protein [Pseudomonadota bacterium]
MTKNQAGGESISGFSGPTDITIAQGKTLAEGKFLSLKKLQTSIYAIGLVLFQSIAHGGGPQDWINTDFNDSHFHLTNYVQEGPNIKDFVEMMGSRIGRSTLFGIPLQQQWSYANTGDWAPTYYLHTDAPLYYYSFTDAHIAMAYLALSEEDQARLDPMITGFNPADMYAVDHIKRVLTTFPGVFSGIGEFTIHKEFVSSKISGEVASLTNPALDRILEFAGEAGLVVIIHNDIDMPFPKPDQEPYMLAQMKALFARHPETTIIWAHIGLGRVVRPLEEQAAMAERALADPALKHVYMDISWDEVAKYGTATPKATKRTADVINRFPNRFLFGTDVVAPESVDAMVAVYDKYAPLWAALTPEASEKVRKGNYERIFNEARRRVRSWEKEHVR